MDCRYCGVEVSDNALICFRCGRSTHERLQEPLSLRRRSTTRLLVPIAIAALFVSCVGLFMMQLPGYQTTHPFVWGMLVVAGLLLAWRFRLTR